MHLYSPSAFGQSKRQSNVEEMTTKKIFEILYVLQFLIKNETVCRKNQL